jgi:ribosomal protein S18 acetylase RimI-like enzyme
MSLTPENSSTGWPSFGEHLPWSLAAFSINGGSGKPRDVQRRMNIKMNRPCLEKNMISVEQKIGEKTYTIRELGANDLEDLFSLHCKAVKEANSDGFVRLGFHKKEYFAENLQKHGSVLGVYYIEKLVAYGSLRYPAQSEINFGKVIGLSAENLEHVTHLNGCAVSPRHRGVRIQDILTVFRLSIAKSRRFHHIFIEVHLNNPFSLYSAFNNGLTVRAITEDGDDKYLLLHRDIRSDIRYSTLLPARVVNLADLKGHQNALASGLVGSSFLSTERSTEVLYVPE